MADHDHPGNVSFSVDHNVGFHFLLNSKLVFERPSRCKTLCLDYALPPGLFADPYELELHNDAYTYEIDAMPDLERPVFAVEASNTLLHLYVNSFIGNSGAVDISLPLHARYGYVSEGAREEAYAKLFLPTPHAFWQCPDLGIMLLVGLRLYVLMWFSTDERTISLKTISPAQGIPLLVPVGLSDDLSFVETVTALSVLVVFGYLAVIFSRIRGRLANRLYQSKME
jgi:GPI mannosyltransferase 1 subunit X